MPNQVVDQVNTPKTETELDRITAEKEKNAPLKGKEAAYIDLRVVLLSMSHS